MNNPLFFSWGETMPRAKIHKKCPNVDEILEAYRLGLADRDYTIEWLTAIGKTQNEAEKLVNECTTKP